VSTETLPAPATDNRWSRPSFFGAFRAAWLFTWQTQLTWTRLSATALGLLALPLLVYFTTQSPEAWSHSHRLQMGNPATYLSGFGRRISRLGVPLKPAQQADLARIFTEEFQRAERDWAAQAATDPTMASQREYSDLGLERILTRARDVLDERQFAEYKNYQRRHRNQTLPTPGEPGWGRTTPFYRCLIDVYFFIVLPLNCVKMCGALIRDELEANTLTFLTTRPLSRARLLVAKYLSQTAWLQLWLLLQTVLILAVGRIRAVPDLPALLPVLLGAQFLAVLVWSALGLFLGLVSKRYMALALLYGFIVEMGIGRIPTNINSLSMVRHLQRMLAHNPALQETFQWTASDVTGPASALILAAACFLILASMLFTYREYHHTAEMQK
jgi:hypothetical protein